MRVKLSESCAMDAAFGVAGALLAAAAGWGQGCQHPDRNEAAIRFAENG